jgi:hypothetical protein
VSVVVWGFVGAVWVVWVGGLVGDGDGDADGLFLRFFILAGVVVLGVENGRVVGTVG